MNRDVILLNPSYVYPPFGPGDRRALQDDPLFMDLPGEEFLYPPIGLLSIAGALKRAGYTVEGIDSNTHVMTPEELARYCEGAKVVGISLLVANLRATYQIIQVMKGRGYEIVLGGAYPSVTPEVVAQMGLRYGIAGEGEVAFIQLCDALIRGEGKPEDISGVIIAEDEQRVWTRPPELVTDLSSVLPDRSLMRKGTYKLPFTSRLEVALASRGCPYACTFCYCSSASPNSMFTTSRWTDIDVIVGDVVDTVAQYDPPYLEMIDETFTVDRDYVMQFCQALIEAGVTVPWGAKTRFDLVDEELLQAMARAGCRKIGFGLESGVYDHRKAMKKNFGNDKVAEVLSAARTAGLETSCTIIFGHPDETLAEMQASVDMVKEVRPTYVEFHIMVLIPKTHLFRQALAEGKVQEDVYERFMLGEVGYPEYAPGDLTPEDMRRVHRKAVRDFYFRPSYMVDTLKRLRSTADLMQHARAARSLLKMTDLRRPVWAVGRSRLGS